MKAIVRDKNLEERAITMIKSGDIEMIEMGIAILANYMKSWKHYKHIYREYYPPIISRDFISISGEDVKKSVKDNIVRGIFNHRLRKIAKENEIKRRFTNVKKTQINDG